MKTLLGIAFGFMFTPAVIGIMALFVWADLRLGLNRADVAFGGFLGVGSFAAATAIAVYFTAR